VQKLFVKQNEDTVKEGATFTRWLYRGQRPRVSEFRHNAVWGYAHLAVLLSTPLFIVIALGLMRVLAGKADWHALIGGSLTVIGLDFIRGKLE